MMWWPATDKLMRRNGCCLKIRDIVFKGGFERLHLALYSTQGAKQTSMEYHARFGPDRCYLRNIYPKQCETSISLNNIRKQYDLFKDESMSHFFW